MIRVGRITYENNRAVHPSYPDFEPIVVMTKSSRYGSLGPYCLQNEHGHIMENIWQFSKVYATVPDVVQRYSRWDSTIIWQHPAERHVDEKDQLTPEYWRWRQKGLDCPYPVRYPVGLGHRHNCLYAFRTDPNEKLDYVQARKEIYLPEYDRLVRSQRQFEQLRKKLAAGHNLLILEVDGPHEESLPYYCRTYGVENDFIQRSTVEVTAENMNILLHDTKHAFGHGYCLGMALLNLD